MKIVCTRCTYAQYAYSARAGSIIIAHEKLMVRVGVRVMVRARVGVRVRVRVSQRACI